MFPGHRLSGMQKIASYDKKKNANEDRKKTFFFHRHSGLGKIEVFLVNLFVSIINMPDSHYQQQFFPAVPLTIKS